MKVLGLRDSGFCDLSCAWGSCLGIRIITESQVEGLGGFRDRERYPQLQT